MTPKREYRFMDTRRLFILSKKAWDHHYDKAPTREFLKEMVDREGKHLVAFHFPHNDISEIRTLVLVKVIDSTDPVELMLDMSIEDFDKLEVWSGQVAGE